MKISITNKNARLCAFWFMGILGVAVLMTFHHYGISWDEEIQNQYGQAVLDYYLSGFIDHRFQEIFNLYLYGGMFDGLASLLNLFSPLSIYSTRHLLNAIIGLVGLWGTWRVGRLMGGERVGLIALVLLALTPMYYGHMFNNPKDIPFATGIIWSVYYMIKCLMRAPNHISPRLMTQLGIVLGLTLGIRVGGVMLLGYFGLIYLFQQRKDVFAAIKVLAPIGLIAYIVMLLCWPWAQQSPIVNPLRALSEFSNFPQDVEVLLNGTIYRSTQLPWTYLPLYFGVQLPIFFLGLILFTIGLLPFLWEGLSDRRGKKEGFVLLLMMSFIPMAYAIARKPALYDAIRHFIFVLPLLSVLSAITAQKLLTWVPARKSAHAILAAFLILVMGSQIVAMVRLHPYEYIYINGFEGGVARAFGNYELDYWGSSFKEAAEKLDAYVINEGDIPPGKIYRVAICGPWSAATVYLPPNYEAVKGDEDADFFLSTTRWNCQTLREGREIIRIERLGVPLSIVKDLRPYIESNFLPKNFPRNY